mgnify:FL=1
MKKERSIIFRIKGALLIILAMVLLGSCEEEKETEDPTPQGVIIRPEEAAFSVGEQRDFSALVITESGDTLDIDNPDIELKWWSSDTTVFTVKEGGTATGRNAGEAYCIAEVTISDGTTLKRLFTGRDSAFVSISGF